MTLHETGLIVLDLLLYMYVTNTNRSFSLTWDVGTGVFFTVYVFLNDSCKGRPVLSLRSC